MGNPYAPVADTKQDLAVSIWYPADPTILPLEIRNNFRGPEWSPQPHEGFILGRLLSRYLTRVEGHSWRDAEVSRAQATYPVVILRAGGEALTPLHDDCRRPGESRVHCCQRRAVSDGHHGLPRWGNGDGEWGEGGQPESVSERRICNCISESYYQIQTHSKQQNL